MDERTTVDCVANARALAPVLAAAAPRIELGRELPPDLVGALHEARMFRMLVPRSLGGEEISPVAFVQAIEELAKVDASTAWCIAQTSVCSTISKSMPRPTAEAIFTNNPRGVLAWGASTHNNAKAVAEEGGFRVTGVWPFASGSRHATWLAAHCFIVEPDGTPRRDAEGNPVQKTLVVPRERAAINDVWHVIGLKGTGSDSYAFTDEFVPEDRAIAYHAMDPAEWREHGPLYSFSIYQLFGSTFPAVALGIRAPCSMPSSNWRAPKWRAADRRRCATMRWCNRRSASRSASSPPHGRFTSAPGRKSGRRRRAERCRSTSARLRMASIHASQQARQVVETIYLAAGATAVFASNPFERRFRDMHAVSQQAQSQFAIFDAIGRYFLRLGANPRLF